MDRLSTEGSGMGERWAVFFDAATTAAIDEAVAYQSPIYQSPTDFVRRMVAEGLAREHPEISKRRRAAGTTVEADVKFDVEPV